jgi:hypothetical protein
VNLTPQQIHAATVKASYAASLENWDWVAGRLREARENGEAVGLDTEFYGVDITKFSPAGGAVRVHVWSLAFLRKNVGPRGWRQAVGCTLPADALYHRPIVQELEDPRLLKAVHNLPVDYHSIKAHGVSLQGGLNTLSLARWVWPERKNSGEGFGLKDMMPLLGRKPLGDFSDLLSEPNVIESEKSRKVRACECGAKPCKRRGKGHVRRDDVEVYKVYRTPANKPRRQVPLEVIVPGHWLWPVLVPYAAEDAEAALDLLTLAKHKGKYLLREVPWLQ